MPWARAFAFALAFAFPAGATPGASRAARPGPMIGGKGHVFHYTLHYSEFSKGDLACGSIACGFGAIWVG